MTPARVDSALRGLAHLYQPVFAADWYLAQYPDLESTTLSPLRHFILHGELEGRDPNPHFCTRWVSTTQGARVRRGRPFESFLRADIRSGFNPHPCIDMAYLASSNESWRTNRDALRGIMDGTYTGDTSDWFSRTEYRQIHEDLAAIPDPEAHFLSAGIHEGRRPSRACRAVLSQDFTHGQYRACPPVASFRWEAQDWVVIRSGPSPSILAQLDRAQQMDPRLNAPGALCVASLPHYRATDLAVRDLIDIDGLTELANEHTDFVFVVPSIGLGGGEKYAIQLAGTLAQHHGARVLMLVENESQEAVDELLRTLRRHDLTRVQVVALPDLLARTWKAELVLALLLVALEPKAVFLANTEVGFQAVSTYGRALSQVTSLLAIFFSESPRAVGAPYSARFADRVADHALLLSDNQALLRQLDDRLIPETDRRGQFVLPQFVEPFSPAVLDAETRVRASRWSRRRTFSVLWISRWEPHKNTDVLIRTAQTARDCAFTAYGPGQGSATALPGNLTLKGPARDLDNEDLSGYDCFLFTSLFEGMPNIVLEMVARGIPVVAPRVGGLHETFSDDGIWFYDNLATPAETADAVRSTLTRLMGSDFTEVSDRCARARTELWARHSRQAYLASLSRLLSQVGAVTVADVLHA